MTWHYVIRCYDLTLQKPWEKRVSTLKNERELSKMSQTWRQEGILGTVFEGSLRRDCDRLIPRIRGSAFITAETTLLFDPADPFRLGIRS